MLLLFLDNRFDVSDDRRRQVEDCTDVSQLEAWFDRALAASSLDQVFAG